MLKLPYEAPGDKVRRKNLTEDGDEENEQFRNSEICEGGGGFHVVNRHEVGQEEKCVSSRRERDEGKKIREESKWE